MGFNLLKKPLELSKEEIAELLNTSPGINGSLS